MSKTKNVLFTFIQNKGSSIERQLKILITKSYDERDIKSQVVFNNDWLPVNWVIVNAIKNILEQYAFEYYADDMDCDEVIDGIKEDIMENLKFENFDIKVDVLQKTKNNIPII